MFTRQPRYMDEDDYYVIVPKQKKGRSTANLSPSKMLKALKEWEEFQKAIKHEEKKDIKKDEKKGNPHVAVAVLCVLSFLVGPVWLMALFAIGRTLGLIH